MSDGQRSLMGAYFRQQRRLADMSMRQVSGMAGISNPYLSQIERGLRAPSEAVAAGIASALGISLEEFHSRFDAEESDDERMGVLEAIANSTELTRSQQVSLSEIYRSFVRSNESEQSDTGEKAQRD